MSAQETTAAGIGTLPTRETRSSPGWFREHFDEAAGHVIDFFGSDGVDLTGKDVADVGAGDGIIDLGVFMKAKPASLVGFDIVPIDRDRLLELARRDAGIEQLPNGLEFVASQPTMLPTPDAGFDAVFSWSTFEHVADPALLLREVKRILRPHGILMIQIWPLFHSQHGSHLWHWFPEGFVHLMRTEAEIEADVRRRPGPDPLWAEELLAEFRSCNRITLDGLQAALIAAELDVRKIELTAETVHVPPALDRYPLSQLSVSGVKLLASPRV